MKKIWWLIAFLLLVLFMTRFREGLDMRGGGSSSSTPPPMAVTQESPTEEYATPTCPAGTTLDVRKKCIYPDEPEMFICPSGYIPTGSRTCRKQGSINEEIPPQCSAGKVFDSERGGCVKPDAPGTCPAGYTLRVTSSSNTCVRPVATTGGTTGGTGMSQNTSVSTTTGTTTGGSSTSSFGPTSGGGRRGQIFGPTSNGMGDSDGKVRPMDSTKINSYPELLGGGDSKPSTRIDGAGIVAPSKNWQLANNGSLPSSASLGSDENSKYLPYSRQPGDMELIPDPYRVSQQFSSASYSFKTEPTPFLTDFSAFLR